jgi:putative ABC transport system permease protein
MISISNLRRQRTQSVLIGLTIAVAVFLSALSFSLLSAMDKPYQKMFEVQKGSHVNYVLDRNFYDIQSIVDWWRSRPGTADSYAMPMAYMGDSINRIGRADGQRQKISSMLYICEYDPAGNSDRLVGAGNEGLAAPGPGPGEVWLPNAFAQANKIVVGDSLEIPVDSGIAAFRVSALVIDPVFSSAASMNPVRAWIGKGELGFYYKAGSLHWNFVGARLVSPASETEAINAFNEHMGGGVNGTQYKYSDLLNVFGAFFSIIAFALIALSALTLLIAAFSIYNTVSGSINADYRRIGILKSLGFTPGNIVTGYSQQFFLIALIASPPALIASVFTGAYVQRRFFSQVSVMSGPGIDFGVLALCSAFFLAAIPLIAAAVALKAGRVNAVEAIRLGETSSVRRLKAPPALRSLKRLPLVAALALKQLSVHKRRSAANGITVLLCAFVFLYGVDLRNFFATTAGSAPLWGMDQAEVNVKRGDRRFTVERDRLWSELAQDERVLRVFPLGPANITVPASGGRPAESVYGIVFEGDMDAAGYQTIAGRNPKNPNEIALGVNSLKSFGKKVGDTVEVVIAGQKLAFTISGVYQMATNMGKGFRLLKDGYLRGDPSYRLDAANLILRDKGQTDEVIQSLEAKYGEAVDATDNDKLVASAMRQITGAISAVVLVFMLIILSSGFAVIYGNAAIELEESKRVFGIYKTLGITPGQLRLIVVVKSALVGLAASAAGCLLVVLLQEPALMFMLSGFGFRNLGLRVEPLGAAGAIVGLGVFAAFSAWLPSRAAKKLNVRELIVE